MKLSLVIEGKNVDLFIVKTNETDYVRLAKALLERLSDVQLDELTYIRNENRFIIFNELIKQYLFKGLICKETGNCICGACISNKYLVINKNTNQECVVGSVCKDNWCIKDCFSYYCQFCNRKKSNKENCKDCQGKSEARSIFNVWKHLIQDKVDFGKFKGMSYYKLVDKQPSYCDWILKESKVSDYRKSKIRILQLKE
jgi:hypothetical protein